MRFDHADAWRLGSLLVVQLFGLLASPISWTHHWVWVVPLMIWLIHGPWRQMPGARVLGWGWVVLTLIGVPNWESLVPGGSMSKSRVARRATRILETQCAREAAVFPSSVIVFLGDAFVVIHFGDSEPHGLIRRRLRRLGKG